MGVCNLKSWRFHILWKHAQKQTRSHATWLKSKASQANSEWLAIFVWQEYLTSTHLTIIYNTMKLIEKYNLPILNYEGLEKFKQSTKELNWKLRFPNRKSPGRVHFEWTQRTDGERAQWLEALAALQGTSFGSQHPCEWSGLSVIPVQRGCHPLLISLATRLSNTHAHNESK